MIEIKKINLDRIQKQFREYVQKGDDRIEEVLFDLANDTQGYAVDGISKPPKTGRIYKKYNPKRTHQASAPGQFPATDLGKLIDSVKVERESSTVYRVGTDVMYGKYLELGTTKMQPRPWLLRSFNRAVDDKNKELKRV